MGRFFTSFSYTAGYRRDMGVLVLLAVLLFALNGTVSPPDIMESRNLATAREMVDDGHWLVPTLNGDLRLEKPPLPTWGAAVVEMAFPGSLRAQRLLSAFMGWVLLAFAYMAVWEWRRNRQWALVVASVLASCYSVMFMARNATWDIWCHAFTMGAIYFYLRATRRAGARRGDFCLAGLFLGLSFLSKGPVSLYALWLPFLIAYHTVERPALQGKWAGIGAMTAVCILVGTWWYAYLYGFEYDKISYVTQKESTAWANHNVRPWHYYKFFFTESGIWCLWWLTALVDGWRYRNNRSLRVALVWTLAALVLLSLMPEKKNRYLLPMMVPCAFSVGLYLEALVREGFSQLHNRRIFRGNVAVLFTLLIAIGVALPVVSLGMGQLPVGVSMVLYGLWFIPVLWYCGVVSHRRCRVLHTIIANVLAMCVVSAWGIRLAGVLMVNPSYHSLGQLQQQAAVCGLPAYYPQQEELRPELIYAARRCIRPLDWRDSTAVKARAPFLLVASEGTVRNTSPGGLRLERIGLFDDNWGAPGSRHYKQSLRKEVWKVCK